jgi:Ni/Fe-hydrogenase subunit HybB-like protein
MSENVATTPSFGSELRRVLRHVRSELRPKGRLLTPFNVISVALMATAAVLLAIRFTYGLGSVSNLTQDVPWGLWKGFNVVTGVAFAGGAYVVTFLVYILNLERYKPIVRVTVLNGLLAYVFYAGALLLDLGRPWNVMNPIIGNSFGLSSVLFLVAWHFLLYMVAQFLEFSPAVAEWLHLRKLRNLLASLTLGAVIFGICLSMLHQSGLGALYMMAKSKIHPLWYSEFIPILFLVSSVFAGLSMVILEGTISHRVFDARLSPVHRFSQRGIVLGLSRICAGAMFVYLFLKMLVLIHGQHTALLFTGWGAWYALEVVGFVAVPCVLFLAAYRKSRARLAQVAAVISLVGIVLNRLNVSIIAFRWDAAVRYVPSWMEVVVSLAVVCAEIWVFRWVVNRMPVLSSLPAEAPADTREPLPALAHAKEA